MKLTKDQKTAMEDVVYHLRDLGDGTKQPVVVKRGICAELYWGFGLPYEVMYDGVMRWPKYSGRRAFPIPHETCTPHGAYRNHYDLWADDAYGDLRRELCLWLADYFEEKYL